ncbi:hypothetical protein THAOC_09725, partial [Thalassiosira oceanica]
SRELRNRCLPQIESNGSCLKMELSTKIFDAEERPEEHYSLVAVMNPHGVRGATFDGNTFQRSTANEGMPIASHCLDHGVNHPPVEQNL